MPAAPNPTKKQTTKPTRAEARAGESAKSTRAAKESTAGKPPRTQKAERGKAETLSDVTLEQALAQPMPEPNAEPAVPTGLPSLSGPTLTRR